MERNLGFKERRYIEELRILTKSTALDCLIDDKFDRIIYVIKAGDMGYAIGKKGDNIRRLQGVTGRKVEMVEFAENLKEFLANIFKPAQILRYACDDQTKKMNIVVSDKNDVGIAIGSGTDVAIETGDIVLMKDDLLDAVAAIQLSRKVISRIKLNIFWAFAYNALLVPVAAGALYPLYGITFRPELAGLAMALSSVTVVTLSLLLKRYIPPATKKKAIRITGTGG